MFRNERRVRLKNPNIPNDTEHMNRPRVHTYTKIAPTQHWRRVGDAWGRDWIVRRSDGVLLRGTYREGVTA